MYVSLAVATAAKLLASAVAFGQSTKYDVKWNSYFIKLPQAVFIYEHHVQEIRKNPRSSHNLKSVEIFLLHLLKLVKLKFQNA